MKTPESIMYGSKAKHLVNIVKFICQELPQVEMIILYGSYARGNYVHLDFKEEFGVSTMFRSDFDILVVTDGIPNNEVSDKLTNVGSLYRDSAKYKPPLQLIHNDINDLNQFLSEGRYFYDQLKREGVMLYNSGRFKLARKRKLTCEEIKKQAEDYYECHYQWGCETLELILHHRDKMDLGLLVYHLHQACESFYYAIRLVHTLKNSKQHDLPYLVASVKKYSEELPKVFPRDTDEEKRLFKLLRAGYVEARYNYQFKVTKEDIDALIPKVILLKDVTRNVCMEKINTYEKEISKLCE